MKTQARRQHRLSHHEIIGVLPDFPPWGFISHRIANDRELNVNSGQILVPWDLERNGPLPQSPGRLSVRSVRPDLTPPPPSTPPPRPPPPPSPSPPPSQPPHPLRGHQGEACSEQQTGGSSLLGGGFRFFLCTPYLFVSTKDCHLLTVTAVTELLMMVMKVRMLMMTTGDIEQYLAIVINLHQLFNYKFPKTQNKSAETQLPSRWLCVKPIKSCIDHQGVLSFVKSCYCVK